MDTYSAQTTAHVGYVLALAVGIVAIIYQLKHESFFDGHRLKRWIFYYLPLSLLVASLVYVGFRIIFWAWMSSAVLGVTQDQAIGVTTIAGIQSHLLTSFSENSGLTSFFYSLDQNRFGSSLFIFFLLSFILLILFDSWYTFKKKENKWQWLFLILLLVFLATIMFVALFPTLINP